MFRRIVYSLLALPLLTCTTVAYADHVVTEFKDAEKVKKEWTPLSDTVMGGRSNIAARLNDRGNLEISGKLSFENEGGFARIYGPELACPTADYDTVKVRFRGDGKCYEFSVFLDGSEGCGVSLWKDTVKDEWMELMIPLEQFKPNPDSVLDSAFTTTSGKKLTMTVMVTGKAKAGAYDNYEELKKTQAGDFQVEIESISLANSRKAGVDKNVKDDAGKVDKGHVLTQFESNKQVKKNWRPLNDNVMGGISTGAVRLNPKGNLEFYGSLSYENRGGFSKMLRQNLACPDADFDTVEMKVKGDGKMFNYTWMLVDQSDPKVKHVCMVWKNSVKDKWTTLKFRLSQFKPGDRVEGNPPLTTTRGKVLGLYLTAAPYPSISKDPKVVKEHREKQLGEFLLEIESIKLTNSKDEEGTVTRPAK